MLAKLINALYAGMPDSVQVLADYLREQGVEEAAVNDLINSLLFGSKTPPHRERIFLARPFIFWDTETLGEWAGETNFFRNLEKTAADTNAIHPRRLHTNMGARFTRVTADVLGGALNGEEVLDVAVNRRRALTVPLVEVVRRGAFGYPLLVELDDRDDFMVHVRHYARGTDGPRIRIAFHGWCSEGVR